MTNDLLVFLSEKFKTIDQIPNYYWESYTNFELGIKIYGFENMRKFVKFEYIRKMGIETCLENCGLYILNIPECIIDPKLFNLAISDKNIDFAIEICRIYGKKFVNREIFKKIMNNLRNDVQRQILLHYIPKKYKYEYEMGGNNNLNDIF